MNFSIVLFEMNEEINIYLFIGYTCQNFHFNFIIH